MVKRDRRTLNQICAENDVQLKAVKDLKASVKRLKTKEDKRYEEVLVAQDSLLDSKKKNTELTIDLLIMENQKEAYYFDNETLREELSDLKELSAYKIRELETEVDLMKEESENLSKVIDSLRDQNNEQGYRLEMFYNNVKIENEQAEEMTKVKEELRKSEAISLVRKAAIEKYLFDLDTKRVEIAKLATENEQLKKDLENYKKAHAEQNEQIKRGVFSKIF